MSLQVLTIQSHVVAGQVGNDAALFTLQRLGIEAWPSQTVQLSNHTGHGAWMSQAFAAAHVRALVDGLDARGLLVCVDAVLFLWCYLQHSDIALALSRAVSSLFALVEGTDDAMPRDLNLIALHDQLVNPAQHFTAVAL